MNIKSKRYEEETISNSGLGELEKSPVAYRKYKDERDQKETKSFFTLGSAVHCKALEPEEFEDRFVVLNIVDPSPMYKKFIDRLFLNHIQDDKFVSLEGLAKASALADAYAESGFKWSQDKVVEKFTKDNDLQDYWKALQTAYGKELLSGADERCMEACLEGIKQHSKASELIFGYQLSEVKNEFEIIWNKEGYDFMLRSIIDRLVIDHNNKIVHIIDLKTTGKPVLQFGKSYKMYKYYRQLAYYRDAVKWYMKENSLDGYSIDYYIVASETNGSGTTLVYKPVEEDIEYGVKEYEVLLDRMKWHFDNEKWDYPMEYYLNDGILELKLDESEKTL